MTMQTETHPPKQEPDEVQQPKGGCLQQAGSPCRVCADVRARLKGHEASRLDGEHGLAAATMRGFERLLELETWPAKFRAEAAELRKANTPKATGGAIVYEDMAGAIERLLGQANAESIHPESKPNDHE